MSDSDAPLTIRQQRMMAYIDDELPLAERRSFEEEAAADLELAAEVADYRELMDISRSMPLLEPQDHELSRFWARFYSRAEWRIGWVLFGLGALVLTGYGLYEMLVSGLPPVVKGAVVSVAAGAGILLWSTLRQKLRALRVDRYRGVLR